MHTYTIREMSELFSLPASTLRYYESEGLLPLVEKNSSGQRIYTKEHIDRLQCINCFKRTGMTIPQLRKFLNMKPMRHFISMTSSSYLKIRKNSSIKNSDSFRRIPHMSITK